MTTRICPNQLIVALLIQVFVLHGLVIAAISDNTGQAVRVAVITEANGPHLGIYFPAIAASSPVAAAAVVDPSGTTFKEAVQSLGKLEEFKTYRDSTLMLKEFRPHLVLIALPAHKAPAQIRASLNAGCHVVAEKPACVRPEDFEQLVELAESKSLKLMLALPSRLSPDIQKAKEIVERDYLGKLYGVTFFQVKDQARLTRPSYHDSWFARSETAGGGHLIWLGIHNLDQVLYITKDRVTKVTAFTNNVGGQPVQIEDAEAVAFQFRSGMLGSFHGGYYVEGGSYQAGTTLWGSKGWLKMSGYRGGDGSRRSFQWYSTHPDAPRGVQTVEEADGINSYQLLVQAAIDSARGVREAPLTGAECLHVLQTIFGAYRAAESGQTQTVN